MVSIVRAFFCVLGPLARCFGAFTGIKWAIAGQNRLQSEIIGASRGGRGGPKLFISGGRCGARTCDLLLVRQSVQPGKPFAPIT